MVGQNLAKLHQIFKYTSKIFAKEHECLRKSLMVADLRSAKLQDLNHRNFAGQRTCVIKHQIVKLTQLKIKA